MKIEDEINMLVMLRGDNDWNKNYLDSIII